MNIQVVLLPAQLQPQQVVDHTVVVFDVLRATTSMASALAAGVSEIRVFDSLESAQSAALACDRPRLLCGERNALRPEGFDLGNSPAAFIADLCRDKALFFSTTNGTRALVAARKAKNLLIGALVNATTAAKQIAEYPQDVTLLCSGTNGEIAPEDVLGAGAVIDALQKIAKIEMNVMTVAAHEAFLHAQPDLDRVLRTTQGGRNIIAVGLDADIEFAARLDSLDVGGIVVGDPLTVRRAV